MIREILPVRQNEGEPFRRWFTDDYWDLYVWFNDKKKIVGFQLCYGKPDDEHALTWLTEGKFIHTRVSDSSPGRYGPTMEAPILVADGLFDFSGSIVFSATRGVDGGSGSVVSSIVPGSDVTAG